MTNVNRTTIAEYFGRLDGLVAAGMKRSELPETEVPVGMVRDVVLPRFKRVKVLKG